MNRTRKLFSTLAAASLTSLAAIGLVTAPATASSSTPGVTSSSITIGATVPLTGIASAGYSDVAKAANAVFKYVNAKGGVNGRKINFLIQDDCYCVAGFGCTGVPNTVTDTNTLLTTSGGLFATVGSLGTPTQDSVRALLNNDQTPQLFVNSGSTDWNNPSAYPGLFGFQTDYIVEGKKLGFIGQSDDFGTNGLLGLQRGGLSIPSMGSGDSFGYDPAGMIFSDPFPTQLLSLKRDGVQVVVLDTIPQATKRILDDAAKAGYHPQFIISGVGADPQTVNDKNEVGAITLTFLPATFTTNAWNSWIAKVLLDDKADFPKFTTKSVLTGNQQYGAAWAVAFLQLVKAMGSNATQANAISTLETQGHSFVTPAVTPLAYSSSDHQGLAGGMLVTVKSSTVTAPVNGQVYTTTDAAGVGLTNAKYVVSTIPTWLK